MTTTPPRIPRPPSAEELDEVSREQSMIADEWAPEPKPKQPDRQVGKRPEGAA